MKIISSTKDYRLIDLFAGIGGIRLAFSDVFGDNVVFSSEIDKYARAIYTANFKDIPQGDITKIDESLIPSFDILLAGFPCQPFSNAGPRRGFNDERAHLFFHIERIVKYHRPQVVFLENVKGLKTHDKGNTYKTIYNRLKNLGYSIHSKILNAKDFGVPQNRERIFIVCFRDKKIFDNFQFPQPLNKKVRVQDLLEKEVEEKFYYTNTKHYHMLKKAMTSKDTCYQLRRSYVRENKNNLCPTLTANIGTGGNNVPLIIDNKDIRKLTPRECARFQGISDDFALQKNITKVGDILEKEVSDKYTISDKLWAGHQRRKAEHQKKGNGFGYSLFNHNSSYTSTISARYYKDGSEILIEQAGRNPRKLTPTEATKLQGFPSSFNLPVSDTQAYKHVGNSVCVPLVRAIAYQIKKCLDDTTFVQRNQL